MNIQLTLAARYLFGRKLRTVLTTLAVVFGVLVIFGMNTVLPTMLEAFQANILAASGQVDVTITHQSGEAFAVSVLNRVKAIEGVRAAAGSLGRTVNLPQGWFGRNVNISAVSLVGLEPRSAQTIRNYSILQGRFLRTNDTLAAVITTSLADQLGLKVGDEINLPTPEGTVALTLVGLRPARTLPGNEEVLITLFEAQKLLDLPKRINTIEANLDTTDPARREAIQKAIEAQLGKSYQFGALGS
ncbi:MAG TPA: ABC transporter permease, partial [Anaerolineales bacterium]|nr:ABC transporter permease [Anaerolineales bacterium]